MATTASVNHTAVEPSIAACAPMSSSVLRRTSSSLVTVSSATLLRDREHDFPELARALEMAVCVGSVGERERSVDDRPQLGALDQIEQAGEILPRGHGRAEHREVLPPDPVEAGRRIRTAGRAA